MINLVWIGRLYSNFPSLSLVTQGRTLLLFGSKGNSEGHRSEMLTSSHKLILDDNSCLDKAIVLKGLFMFRLLVRNVLSICADEILSEMFGIFIRS